MEIYDNTFQKSIQGLYPLWNIPISVKITKIILSPEKYLKSAKKSKAFLKNDEVLGGIMKY